MGIKGLLPFLEKSSRPVNISQFKGQSAAIDTYCWLHKGVITCVEQLARGESSDAYVHYCMKYVNMLLYHNIKPILVFDGCHLPAKAVTEKKRRENRESCRKKGAMMLRAGQTKEAHNLLKQSLDITHEMALKLIHECRRRNVDCIVAPYEADAQLAYLNMKNIAQVVITEDSDLVLFGCKKVMFKMDIHGNGILFEDDRLHMSLRLRPENFSFDKFRHMCILSGCDYLPSLPGIGLVKACKFITSSSDADIHRALTRLPLFLNKPQLAVTSDYRDDFLRADATFRYQLVYDPLARRLIPLTTPPVDYKPADFSGKPLPSDVAYQLALGNIDPFTLKVMDTYDPDTPQVNIGGKTASWNRVPVAAYPSIWSKGYRIRPLAPTPDPRAIERPTTRGKEVNKGVIDITKKSVLAVPDLSLSDNDLASLYGGQSPSLKRPHLDSNGGSVETSPTRENKPNSLVPSPTISFPDQSAVLASPIKPSSPIVAGSHIAQSPVRSPIIGKYGNQNRNPFLKKEILSKSSPTVQVLSFDSMDPKKKFSALAKFGQMQMMGDSDVHRKVESRYFSKAKAVTMVETSTSPSHEQPLQDILNLTQIEESETVVTSCLGEDLNEQDTDIIPPAVNSKSSVLSPKKWTLSTSSSVDMCMEILDNESSDENKKEDINSMAKLGDKSQSLRNVLQTFKWAPLHNKFGFSGSKQSNQFSSTAASSKPYRPPLNMKSQDDEESNFYHQLALEEAIDDPEIPLSQADSGFESISSFSQDISETDREVSVSFSSSNVTSTMTKVGFMRATKNRRVGLSKKVTNMKRNMTQQSLLTTFGFQKKSNQFQHRQTL